MVRSRRRSVQSALTRPPVDAHERMRDYLTEAEFLLLRHAPADVLSWAARCGAL
jgi:hypothetical protein